MKRLPRNAALMSALAGCAALAGCGVTSVVGAAAGAAISVTGAVVSTGVTLTGKAIGAGIDAVTPSPKKTADASGVVVQERVRAAPPAAGDVR